MLGRLSRWLRVLGYDTLFKSELTDDDIKALLELEPKRILITRDKRLHEYTSRNNKTILILDDDIIKQLAYVNKILNINLKVNPDNSRCSFCNTVVKRIKDITSIKGLVPPLLRSNKRNFWYCSTCNKMFWKGRMWPNINKISSAAIREAKKDSLK
jgi:uncharacterized protein with PIN domain